MVNIVIENGRVTFKSIEELPHLEQIARRLAGPDASYANIREIAEGAIASATGGEVNYNLPDIDPGDDIAFSGHLIREDLDEITGLEITVQPGDSLWKLAKMFDVDINAFQDAEGNPLDPETAIIHPDQLLVIPVGVPGGIEFVTDTPDREAAAAEAARIGEIREELDAIFDELETLVEGGDPLDDELTGLDAAELRERFNVLQNLLDESVPDILARMDDLMQQIPAEVVDEIYAERNNEVIDRLDQIKTNLIEGIRGAEAAEVEAGRRAESEAVAAAHAEREAREAAQDLSVTVTREGEVEVHFVSSEGSRYTLDDLEKLETSILAIENNLRVNDPSGNSVYFEEQRGQLEILKADQIELQAFAERFEHLVQAHPSIIKEKIQAGLKETAEGTGFWNKSKKINRLADAFEEVAGLDNEGDDQKPAYQQAIEELQAEIVEEMGGQANDEVLEFAGLGGPTVGGAARRN